MADAAYQVARVRDRVIVDVLTQGVSTGIVAGADTTIELGSILDARERHDPVRLYVESISGTILAKRASAHLWWRIPDGAYAWFTLLPGQDLIMRQEGVALPTLSFVGATSIPEDTVNGVLGTLTVSSAPQGVTYTFSEIADPDAKFTVTGSNLNKAATFDYDVATSHSVTIRATGSNASTIDRTFTFLVTPLEESDFRGMQIGLAQPTYFLGFSPFLNWAKLAAPIVIERSVGGSLEGQAAFDAGVLSANGDLVTPVAGTITAWRLGWYAISGNVGQDMGGEQFRVDWTGTGTLTIDWIEGVGSVPFAQDGPNTGTATFGMGQGNVRISVTNIDANNPIQPSSVRIYQTRYAANVTAGERFNPHWIEELKSFKTIRTMDWNTVNNSSVVNVNQLATVNYYQWGSGGSDAPGGPSRGVPLQIIKELAEETECHLWVCIPHLASDAFIQHVATYFRDNMPAGLVVKYEFSNEVWNGGFVQSQYAQAQGAIVYAGEYESPFQRGMVWFGYRSTAMMKLISDVYGVQGRDRWRGVLAVFTAVVGMAGDALMGVNRWRTETGNTGLAVSDLYDELAVSGYFSGAVDPSGEITGITQAAQAVVTSTAHGLTVGRRVIISMQGRGMAQIDGMTGTVQSVTANTFTLNINSSAFSPIAAGPATPFWMYARIFDLIDQSAAANPGDPYEQVAEDIAAGVMTGVSPSGLMPPFGTIPDHTHATNGWWTQHKAVAVANGLDMTMYEGGLHLLGNVFLRDWPDRNVVGNRFTTMLTSVSHRPEIAALYTAFAQQFIASGGIEPSKFVEAGLSARFGPWAGVRHWPCANDPDGDLDNAVWVAIKAASADNYVPPPPPPPPPPSPNEITNSSMSGAVLGVLGSSGSLPTGWSIENYATDYGLNYEIWEVGTEGGLPYIEIRAFGTVTTHNGSLPLVQFSPATGLVDVSPGDNTGSVYLRVTAGTGSVDLMMEGGDGAAYRYNDTVNQSSSTDVLHSITQNHDAATTTASFRVRLTSVSGTGTYDFRFRVKGPQMEAGASRGDFYLTGSSTIPNLPHI